jgi:hypothetical protein
MRIATLRHIVTLADACINHGPRIDPERIRAHLVNREKEKMIGMRGHISGMIVNRIKCGARKINDCTTFAQGRGIFRERLPVISPRNNNSSGNPVLITPYNRAIPMLVGVNPKPTNTCCADPFRVNGSTCGGQRTRKATTPIATIAQ